MTIIEQASYSATDVKIEARESVYQGFIQVEKVALRHRLFGENTYTPVLQRELIHRPEAAGVLIYNDEQQKFALIEQFRIGAVDDHESPWQLEVIAGVLDAGESAEQCLYRESLEESGCEIHTLQHLFSFYPSAGACSELFHLYTAQAKLDLNGGIFGMPDEGENIRLHILDYQDIDQLFQQNRLCNAPVIMALQWLRQHVITIIKN
ncbi:MULTISPECIES: NUDIX domain-containing protein [Acinetobacter]|jgi:ADP-ribose pyrophosphatase|uniref:NUDIX domain-containing protein n=1 Tax=Acinetobacter TaxID=469 RepID=UPI000C328045|nr:NUDIX domain-containing protein [Acinetobacter radioresistens]MCK4081527.1 NUDIX domain-containing protein [Acinetobacter radioresistens]MCM1935686.1 NUDIX domain-containing protein [Acinetobacter radioresistens]MCM1953631.1 NUDIX domain-containing protein [Acinetobacter radioresistens]MCU4308319.1 NUDIX domain-containing protein [Acinetobacter radioresistens]MCU4500352.1 NUDIX domain-containing protein [Acinetobacter radioresistens]